MSESQPFTLQLELVIQNLPQYVVPTFPSNYRGQLRGQLVVQQGSFLPTQGDVLCLLKAQAATLKDMIADATLPSIMPFKFEIAKLYYSFLQVLTMTACTKIMGASFKNSLTITVLAWAVALLIMAINLSAIYDFAMEHLPRSTIVLLVFLLVVLFYICFIFYLALGPER